MQVSTKSSPNMELGGERRIHLISPVIRSNSRGARFLDLVAQNKINVSPQLSKRLSSNKAIIKDLMERNSKKDERDYLKFSNALPNPNSSPSSGILSSKRKALEQESSETPDSPSTHGGNSAKRKRVSFNDPVSTTKEYLITDEEERHKSNSLIRCLVYDENSENGESVRSEDKENVKIEDIDKSAATEVKVEVDAKPLVIKNEKPEVLYPVKDHDYYGNDDPQNTDITTSSIEEQLSGEEEDMEDSSNKLSFKNKPELMDYITKNIPIDELLEKFAQADEDDSAKRKDYVEKVLQTITLNELLSELLPLPDLKHTALASEQIEATSNMINHISRMMKVNDRVKHKVLETLSEKHSKDFLTHAMQESSTAQVCEKITMPNIVNYIIHKANTCDDNDDISIEINRMNRTMMHHLVKKTSDTREIIADAKETQELLKLLFKNKQKIDVLDTVHEFLRSNIIHGQF